MDEILTLWSHKLLKNLGALDEYAKCNQSSTKIKKIIILTLPYSWIRWNGKKTFSRYCPFKIKIAGNSPP